MKMGAKSVVDGIVNQFKRIKINDAQQQSTLHIRSLVKYQLKVSKPEWKYAKEHFNKNPTVTWLSKKSTSQISHSFVKISDANGNTEICALANSQLKKEAKYASLSQNNQEKIKLLQFYNGDNIAMRVDKLNECNKKEDYDQQRAELVTFFKKSEQFIGEVTFNESNSAAVSRNVYTAIPYLPGESVSAFCKKTNSNIPDNLSLIESLFVGLLSCVKINNLHKEGIIHGNIDSENLIINRNQDLCSMGISAVNFNFLRFLKEGQQYIYAPLKSMHVAPEMQTESEKTKNMFVHYSIYSDIYALGMIFKNELMFGKEIYEGMLYGTSYHDAKRRTSLSVVMEKIVHKILLLDENCISIDSKNWLIQLLAEVSNNNNNIRCNKSLNHNYEEIRLFYVLEDEWDKAEYFFKYNRGECKWSKNSDKNQHSFIKLINDKGVDEIFVIASKKIANEKSLACLGAGGNSKVKIIQNRQGECIVIKVLNFGKDETEMPVNMSNFQHEIKLLRMNKQFKGSLIRKVSYPWFKKGSQYKGLDSLKALKVGNIKAYVAQTVVPGCNVKKIKHTRNLDKLTKYRIALLIAHCVRELHQRGILHADIKGENIMVDIDDANNISLQLIDFGISLLFDVTSQEIFIASDLKGTHPYVSSELLDVSNEKDKAPFSIFSDIYALGKTFEIDLELEPEIYQNMISGNTLQEAMQRMKISEVIDLLNAKISKMFKKDPEQEFIEQIVNKSLIYSKILSEKENLSVGSREQKSSSNDSCSKKFSLVA